MLGAFDQVRNEIALKEFGISYDEMLANRDDFESQIKIVRLLLPSRISEAEPTQD